MATLPASESTLRASAPVFVPASERECIVCYTSDGDGVACQDGHWTCATCLGPYVRDCCERLDKVNLLEGEAAEAERDNDVKRAHDLAGRISCPKAGVDAAGKVVACAAPPFTDQDVAKHVDAETFEIYFEGRGKLPMARAVTSALQEWQEGAGALRLLFPNARMCGQCSYGPVIHDRCGDLTAHHGEPGNRVRRRMDGPIAAFGHFARSRLEPSSSSSRIDNACPRCGWFAPTISEWPMWNGVLATPEDDVAEEFAVRRRRREDELRREYEAREPQRDTLMHWVMGLGPIHTYPHGRNVGEEERERREEARRASEEARRRRIQQMERATSHVLIERMERQQAEMRREVAERPREESQWAARLAWWAAEEDQRQARREARLRHKALAQSNSGGSSSTEHQNFAARVEPSI